MRRVNQVWGLLTIFTAAPALSDMKVGEIAIGYATESSPASDSNALYIKCSTTAIDVVAFKAGSFNHRQIT